MDNSLPYNQNPFCNTSIGKAPINGQLYSLIDIYNYNKISDTFYGDNPAVVINDEYIVPIKSENSKGYGVSIKPTDPFVIAKLPKEGTDDFDQYTFSGNPNATDWRDITKIHDYLEKTKLQRSSEIDIITSPDNVYQPTPQQTNSPAMYALRSAVCEKHIDIDKYGSRFGSNFNNDKRILVKDDITLAMLTRLCDGLDIKASLTLEDAMGEETPNPIGRKITVELTGGVIEDNE